MAERLDAFLARRGEGSRSDMKKLVRRGHVSVDGEPCRDPARHLSGDERVEVDGREILTGLSEATLIVHKPVGYACSNDPNEAPLLAELVPEPFAHLSLQPAGRLDRETSGLIVVTTDGKLIHALTNPRRKLLKRYRILYRGELAEDAVARCADGIELHEDPKPTLPARLELEEDEPETGLHRATLWLSEGRYHQVRRMIAALGGGVVSLHRDRIGGLDLPADLPAGAARAITDDELASLRSAG